MEKFEEVVVEIIELDGDDIIRTSDCPLVCEEYDCPADFGDIK